jgi:hypothetical protein
MEKVGDRLSASEPEADLAQETGGPETIDEPRLEPVRMASADSSVPALDRSTTGSIQKLAGVWGADNRACSRASSLKSGVLPMIISNDVARAGDAACTFKEVRQTGRQWTAVAHCKSGRERWSSQVTLVLSGRKLAWASERGKQKYIRCGDRVI